MQDAQTFCKTYLMLLKKILLLTLTPSEQIPIFGGKVLCCTAAKGRSGFQHGRGLSPGQYSGSRGRGRGQGRGRGGRQGRGKAAFEGPQKIGKEGRKTGGADSEQFTSYRPLGSALTVEEVLCHSLTCPPFIAFKAFSYTTTKITLQF